MKTFRELAITEKEETHGIFSGRFQPVTKAHAQIVQTIGKENKHGTVFLVKGKKTSEDKERNPFDAETQKKMLQLISPSNVQIKIISTGFFVGELNDMADGTKFVAYAGSDRIKAYEKYNKYMEDDRTLEVREIKRTDDDISATKVREALINNDIEAFKKLTDKKMHKMFEELKSIISN